MNLRPISITPARLGRLAVFAVFSIIVSACSGSDVTNPLSATTSVAQANSSNNGNGNGNGNTGTETGTNTAPSQGTSLATPQPSVVVTGNTVTVSWPVVVGAIDYQVNSSASGIHTPFTTSTSVTATVVNGSYKVSVRARTTASNNESGWSEDITFTVNVATEDTPPSDDDTGPVITSSVIGTMGSNGWYTSPVTVTWTVTDESTITSSPCSTVYITTDQQATTYVCSATSAGGTSTSSVTIKRDASTPSVGASLDGTMGDNDWYVSNVGVSFTVSANGPSGIGSSLGCTEQNVTADGSFSFTCSATSGAGLSSSATASGKKDATVPVVVFGGNAGSYTVDQTVSITCTANDMTSGIASQTCPSASGDAYTFNIGFANVLSASATDNAGNATSATASFTVSVTGGSLCNLTRRFVSHAGIANSLCVKLNAAEAAAARGNLAAKAGPLNAYVKEVQAQTGKAISAPHAAILIRLAGLL